MYIMLSIEATVYADSNDKYISIFKISKTKTKKERKLGLLSEFKYSVTYLQVVWSLVPGGGLGVKVSCPATDSSLQRGQCVSHFRKFA